MSYKVSLPGPIKNKIGTEQLPLTILVRLLTALHGDLAENPDLYRHNILPGSDRIFEYGFTIPEDVRQPLSRIHIFLFLIEDRSAAASFVVVDFKHSFVE